MKRNLTTALLNLQLKEWILIAILLIASFLRLWNFSNTLQFLGDQGRDAIVVSRIFKEKDIILIGPVTSTGNMYLGPLYYYFMAPFLMLSYPSPLGPAYAVAVLSIVTTGLMYWLGKEIVGDRAAMIGALLFALSSTAVSFARFSWNPNPAPLFSLLLLWCLYRTQKKQLWFWAGVSACIAVLIQLHYVTLLTGLIAGFFWLKQAWEMRKQKVTVQKNFVFATLAAVGIFVLSLTPLIAFDFRHEWLNVRSLQEFLATSQNGVASMPPTEKLLTAAAETHGRSLQLLFEITIGKHRLLNTVLLAITVGFLIWLARNKKDPHRLGYQLLLASYVISVCGLAFYRSSVFDHYIAFFFPYTFLIFGGILAFLSRNKAGLLLSGALFIGFLAYNLPKMPLRDLGWTITDMKRTADSIAGRVKPGEKYNIVLLSETKDVYGENYRYFLTTTETPPLRIEHFGEVETLFIIDEQKIVKNVTSLPIYEIVVFPNKEPAEVYNIPGGPQITVLRKGT
jgi:4-amino-4-deoxy-L-arabinose transferase-like glycosyltransferase